uniref:LIM zinc-binding domain-containing protein n=1 Tax=Strix occidentalis caurina TaxID=311401 RepID=A0A8D0FP02_STROC
MLTDPSPLLLFPPSFLPAVPYQQNPYTPGSSSTVIQCYRCGDTCKGEVVRVQSNHFHIRCFTCQVCGCDLAQSGFFFKNQEYICTHDYQQLYGTRCDSCGDFITGEVISALGRTYHPKCFVCSTSLSHLPTSPWPQEAVSHRRQGHIQWEGLCLPKLLALSHQHQTHQDPRAQP